MATAEDFLGTAGLESAQRPSMSAEDFLSAATPVTQQAAATAPASALSPGAKAIYDRLRYMNDVLSFGAYDKLQALAKSYAQGGSYEEQLARERAATQASTAGLGTAEKIGYGLLASAPLAAVGGVTGVAGRAAGLGAPTMPATVGGRIGAGVVEGAAQGALEAVGRDEGVTGGALTGAAIGGAIPIAAQVAGRVISPVSQQLNPYEQTLAKRAQDLGLDLTPGQATGSSRLQFLESQLRQLPGGGMSSKVDQQMTLQRGLLGNLGIVDDLATPQAIKSGFERARQQFDDILTYKWTQQTPEGPQVISGSRPIFLDADFTQQIKNAIEKSSRGLEANVKPVFTANAEELLSLAPSAGRNVIDGKKISFIRSELADFERAYAGNPKMKAPFTELRRAVDQAIDRSIPKEDQTALREVRGLYKDLTRLDEVMSKAGPQSTSGIIPFVQLNNLLQQRAKSVSRGSSATPEFTEAAQIGSKFLREPKSSGTSERTYWTSLLTGGGGAGIAAGPEAALGAMAAGVGVPFASNVLLNTRAGQAYLRNQLGRPIEEVGPAARSALTGAGLGLLGQ